MGIGAGRSGVDWEENFELRLFIHDDLLEPIAGRFNDCLLFDEGVGVEGKAFVVSLAGSTGVGGVTLGGDGSLLGSDNCC